MSDIARAAEKLFPPTKKSRDERTNEGTKTNEWTNEKVYMDRRFMYEQKKEMAANISFNVYNASLILCMAACDYGSINKLYYKANKAHEEKLLE